MALTFLASSVIVVLYMYIPGISLLRSVLLPGPVSAAIPVEGRGDKIVVTVGKRICLMERQTGQPELNSSIITNACTLKRVYTCTSCIHVEELLENLSLYRCENTERIVMNGVYI